MSNAVYPVEEALVRFFRVAAPEEAKERTRDRLLLAAQHRPPPTRRTAKRIVLVLAATLMLSGGAFAAALPVAAGSLPGDALYRVKLAGESLRLTFARGAEADVRLHLEFAQTRLDEMARAVEAERSEALAELARRYIAHVRSAFGLAGDDEELLALVQGALQRHEPVLEALLAEAPASAKDALQRSIDASTKAEGAVADALERRGDGPAGSGGATPATSAPTTVPSGSPTGTPDARPTEAPVPTQTPTSSAQPTSTPSGPPSPPPSGQPTSTPPPPR